MATHHYTSLILCIFSFWVCDDLCWVRQVLYFYLQQVCQTVFFYLSQLCRPVPCMWIVLFLPIPGVTTCAEYAEWYISTYASLCQAMATCARYVDCYISTYASGDDLYRPSGMQSGIFLPMPGCDDLCRVCGLL